jgi:hypothetical protein
VDPLGLASRKYAGADSEEGLSFPLGGLLFDSSEEQLDAFDADQMPRKRFGATSGRFGVKDSSIKDQGPIPSGNYTLRPLRGKNRIFFFKHLIYYAILSSFKGGRHGHSTEGTSVG